MKSQRNGGRISERGRGAGTLTADNLEYRAKEIAETNGRHPEDFTQVDLEQAKSELQGVVSIAADPESESQAGVAEWTEGPETETNQAPTKKASDEQTVAEQLVDEGMADATHEQMVQGNRASREADQA